ncbi:PRC-barrel domain-containing protein [Lichenicola sp.]|uniref:PRC-barrel domain containing protein n=1 Tax=Lichenicola sp. TaxID=2804529 RepID=UPI003B0089CE
MMLAISALKGFLVDASDGRIGTISDFLFDDTTWKIRWMVVDTGGWLKGRKILIHPSAISQPNYRREELSVRLTTTQVKESPDILSDQPVSEQMETELYGYYGWDPLWGGTNYFGVYPFGLASGVTETPGSGDGELLQEARADPVPKGDPHLRSVTSVTGYHLQAKDGPIGHIENILVDDATWGIRYFIIDTLNWWPGKHVLLSPYAVRAISWAERNIAVDVTRDQVQGGPVWDPADAINSTFQKSLHRYYGWPSYGW